MNGPITSMKLMAFMFKLSLLGSLAPVATAMQFGNLRNPFSSKQDGATTVALTLALNVADRGSQSILSRLETLAADADTTSAEGIAALCGDSALALLRARDSWVSCCGESRFRTRDEDALRIFDRIAIDEAAKFDDRDGGATIDAALSAAGVNAGVEGPPTIAVVCAIATLMGDCERETGGVFQGDASSMQQALQELASAARAEDAVFAFELLWVPGAEDEALDLDEVLMDWPALMAC